MKMLSIMAFAVALAACSSAPSSEADDNGQSKYASTLPATDMGVGVAAEGSAPVASTEGPQREYSRQFVLEEALIANEPGAIESSSPAFATESTPQPPSIDIANTFTLQLAAVSTMDGAIDYARKHNIDTEQAGVARILTRGQIFYVLAYGVYTSYESAERASLELQAKGLPEPWIRRLSTLERLSNDAQESGL